MTRFERKILAAIAVVGFTPLVAALFFGNEMLSDAYRDVLNPEWHAELQHGVDVHREYIVALREDAVRTTDAIVNDYRVRAAIASEDWDSLRVILQSMLDRYPHVARISVRAGVTLTDVMIQERQDSSHYRLIEHDRTLDGLSGQPEISVTLTAPLVLLRDFRHAGEMEEVYARLMESRQYISNFYLVGYVVSLLSVIVVALGLGMVLARRVTRRIVDLVDATQKVGAGDLSVEVPTGVDDEIGDLTTSFNDMVRVMRESRERIDYLQKIGAWQDFARRLAHEIKNPLTPIQLAVQEMYESYDGNNATYQGKLADARAIVEEEVATLRRLVGEFSEFAKLPEAQLEDADLGDFLSDLERANSIVSDLQFSEESRVDLDIRLPDVDMPVRIDSMMLRRCLDNLIRNAREALARSDGKRIIVEARPGSDRAMLEVRDDGPGIPESAWLRVFDPYYTTRAEGTGLGLAIVKKVVLEHGGEIACGWAPEGGALFRISLPLRRNGPDGSAEKD